MLNIKCDIDQQDSKIVDLHFVKSEEFPPTSFYIASSEIKFQLNDLGVEGWYLALYKVADIHDFIYLTAQFSRSSLLVSIIMVQNSYFQIVWFNLQCHVKTHVRTVYTII